MINLKVSNSLLKMTYRHQAQLAGDLSCDETSSANDARSGHRRVAESGAGSEVSHRRRPLPVHREYPNGGAMTSVVAIVGDGGGALSSPDVAPRTSHAAGDGTRSDGAASRRTSKGVGGGDGGDGGDGDREMTGGLEHSPHLLLRVAVKTKIGGVGGDAGGDGEGDGGDEVVCSNCSAFCSPSVHHYCRKQSD